MKDPTELKGWRGSIIDLALDVAELRYDVIADFLYTLHVQINKQAENHRINNHLSTARNLAYASETLLSAHNGLKYAWKESQD